MNFHFFQSVNFSSSCRNLGLKKRGFFRKKIGLLFCFSKNNHFRKKLSAEPQSLFGRASLPYFLFFNFPFRNLTRDVTAWTILIRIFERSTSSAFRTLHFSSQGIRIATFWCSCDAYSWSTKIV